MSVVFDDTFYNINFFSLLPAPRQQYDEPTTLFESTPRPKQSVPAYGQREGFIPRNPGDFGDGGSFPEIHVAQYPLNMGKTSTATASGRAKAVETDEYGRVKYDSIMGYDKDQIVHSTALSVVEKQFKDKIMERPDEEALKATTEKTKMALQKVINGKIRATQPGGADDEPAEKTTFLRYTPASGGGAHAAGSQQRIIRLQEAPKDPLDPPKFKNKRAPKGPPSPPVPVLHSPPHKASAEDQAAWKIPPAISNWKNNKGYTIALDKRMVASGAGLQEYTINDNHAKLAEALYIAERTARDELAKRAAIQKKVADRVRAEKERELQDVAARARMHRQSNPGLAEGAAIQVDEDRLEREQVRDERRRERERQLRKEFSSYGGAKSKQVRDEDRDIGEKIALGQVPTTASMEVLYDQRLFNQSGGMDSGYSRDDANNVYDAPLFKAASHSQLYRPKKQEELIGKGDMQKIMDTSRFRPDKGFQGATEGARGSGPVEFERPAAREEDPFGLDAFLSDAKARPLDSIGKGTLHAGAAGGGNADSLSATKRERVDFVESSSKRRK